MTFRIHKDDLLYIDKEHDRVVYQRKATWRDGYEVPFIFSIEQFEHFKRHGFSECTCGSDSN